MQLQVGREYFDVTTAVLPQDKACLYINEVRLPLRLLRFSAPPHALGAAIGGHHRGPARDGAGVLRCCTAPPDLPSPQVTVHVALAAAHALTFPLALSLNSQAHRALSKTMQQQMARTQKVKMIAATGNPEKERKERERVRVRSLRAACTPCVCVRSRAASMSLPPRAGVQQASAAAGAGQAAHGVQRGTPAGRPQRRLLGGAHAASAGARAFCAHLPRGAIRLTSTMRPKTLAR